MDTETTENCVDCGRVCGTETSVNAAIRYQGGRVLLDLQRDTECKNLTKENWSFFEGRLVTLRLLAIMMAEVEKTTLADLEQVEEMLVMAKSWVTPAVEYP